MFLLLQLVPGKHYVPFKSDLSNLSDQLEWIRANDEIASKIVFRAKKFSNQNLLPQHVLCYHAVFLKKWTSRLKPNFIISRMLLDWKVFKFRSQETIVYSPLKLIHFIVCCVDLKNFFCLRLNKQPSFFSIRLKNRNVIIGPEMVIVKKESQYPHFQNECPCPQNKNKEEL